MEQIWLIIALVFVIALVFSMFGQGGGSVYTPVLFLFGYPVLVSVSTSLVLTLITSISAGYIFYRHRMIDFKRAMLFVPGIIIGSVAGSFLDNLHVVSSDFILWLFIAFLIVAGARMIYAIRERGQVEADLPPPSSRRMQALVIAASFLIGLLSSMLGIGGGIFLVPFMVYVCKYPTRIAAGASLLIVTFSALFGVIGHSAFGNVNLSLVLGCGAAVLIAGNLGGRIGVRMKPGPMKVGVGIVLWLLAAQMLLRVTGVL